MREAIAVDLQAPVLLGCGPAAPGAAVPPPELIGFKAHNLARMAAAGLPVPAAFVLGTAWCAQVERLDPGAWRPALRSLEDASGARLGDARCPLLVSVRSGAPVSMPGMMDTLLNVGLTDATLAGFLRSSGNPRLVWDAYRRLIAAFGEIVMGVGRELFDADLASVAGGRDERDLDFDELRTLARAHLRSFERAAGHAFPQDPHEQLQMAMVAVFRSWESAKAREYRRLNALADRPGTAVVVQRMVFGNAAGASGAGVGFTRHPSTGEPQPWIDFLFHAQGEDVVSGRRSAHGHDALAATAPRAWAELQSAMAAIESEFRDMQDFEFTLEGGRLWMLQTRSGKRTVQAQARIALDLLDEGLIDAPEARRRTAGLDAAALSIRRVVAADRATTLAQATSAAHGVAIGEIALDEARARARCATGVAVVLVRQDAETRDIAALADAAGLLTARGARTAHAAVVARQMGKVCLVGCESLRIDLERRRISFAGVDLHEGELLTLDGHAGTVYRGSVHTADEVPAGLLDRLARLRAG